MQKDAPNWHFKPLADQAQIVDQVNVDLSDKGLPRSARFNSKKDFQQVFDQAIKVVEGSFTLLARPNTLGFARLGLAISKKVARRAVDRNRIKRITRESFRLHQGTLGALDIVVLARRDLDKRSKQEMHASLCALWPKLVKRCENS